MRAINPQTDYSNLFDLKRRLAFFSLLRVGLSSLLLLFFIANNFAQVKVEVTVNSGSATSTCNDGIFVGDPLWSVTIENQGWVTYSNESACFTDFPSLQFDTTLACLGDLRGGQIQVCLRAFENDPGLFNPCNIDRTCDEFVCGIFLIPLPGNDTTYSLSIPDGESSGGNVDFTIRTSGSSDAASNDHICHAIDLGVLPTDGTIGDRLKGQFHNYCATGITEPNPEEDGSGWVNNVGTWFTFTTSAEPSGIALVEAFSDPEKVGDPLNLQLALYESSDQTCRGNMQLVAQHHDPSDLDEFLLLECLKPNQQYFILVDATIETEALLRGFFGLQVRESDVQGKNDQICDAAPLEVLEGGMLYQNFFNNCATNTGDPLSNNFSSDHSVWFQFFPTETGSVEIFLVSDLSYPQGIDPIDIEMAVFSSDDNACSGNLQEVASSYSQEDKDEYLRLDCLNPKFSYWLLVDGSESDPVGIFDLIINDPGYPEPKNLDTTICQGEILVLGNKSYAQAGIYRDTIITDEGCVEIVQTNLSIADSISIRLNLERISSGLGESDGIAIVSTSGGSGNYFYAWPNGQTNQVGTNLRGGTNYCVTVSDAAGCERIACFTMEYIIPIEAQVINDTLDCSDDISGQLAIIINAGQAPYTYLVQGIEDPSIVKSGLISNNNNELIINNLSIGNYNVFINNEFTAKNFTGLIEAPPPIEIQLASQINPSCSTTCDGAVELIITGGTGTYQLDWGTNIEPVQNPQAMCAGDYILVVRDANNCIDSLPLSILAPKSAVLEVSQIQGVQCFGESNGHATIKTEENGLQFQWDNGETTQTATSLSGGMHEVTITDENNCESIANLVITEPEEALKAKIEILEAINCGGDANGVLVDASIGGTPSYQYNWSNGNDASTNENLRTGDYALTITDAQGCQDSTSIHLAEPTPIAATISIKDVTCPEGANSGTIRIENISGGVSPYHFALNEGIFNQNNIFQNLASGTYRLTIQDNNGCEKFYETIINDPPELSVSLGEDLTIKLGESIHIEALTNRRVSYQWTSTDSINCLDCAEIGIRPSSNATYTVNVTDIETGCTAEDQLLVTVSKERLLFVPNAFSPNGDGINDELMLHGGADILQIKQFRIFDRKGTMVYEAYNFSPNDFNYGWDGKFNGQYLAPDVFVYLAEVQFIDGERLIFKGDVTLVR